MKKRVILLLIILSFNSALAVSIKKNCPPLSAAHKEGLKVLGHGDVIKVIESSFSQLSKQATLEHSKVKMKDVSQINLSFFAVEDFIDSVFKFSNQEMSSITEKEQLRIKEEVTFLSSNYLTQIFDSFVYLLFNKGRSLIEEYKDNEYANRLLRESRGFDFKDLENMLNSEEVFQIRVLKVSPMKTCEKNNYYSHLGSCSYLRLDQLEPSDLERGVFFVANVQLAPKITCGKGVEAKDANLDIVVYTDKSTIKIVDYKFEGISLASVNKEQYQSILRREGAYELLHRLKAFYKIDQKGLEELVNSVLKKYFKVNTI